MRLGRRGTDLPRGSWSLGGGRRRRWSAGSSSTSCAAPTCGSTRRCRSTSRASRCRDLHEALKHDGAPPLYYVLLHVWTRRVRHERLAARSLSGVCMAGAVVATWFAARRFAGTPGRVARGVRDARRARSRSGTRPKRACTRSRCCSSRAGILAFQRAIEAPTIGRARGLRRARRARRSTRSTGPSISRRRDRRARLAVAGAASPHGRRAACSSRPVLGLPRVPARGSRRSCTSARTPVRRGATPVLPGLPHRLHAARLRRAARRAARRPPGGLAAVPRPHRRCCCSACSDAARRPAPHRDRRDARSARPAAIAFVGGADARRRADAQLPRAATRSSRATARSCSRSSCCSSRGAWRRCATSGSWRRSSRVVVVLGFAGGVRNVVTQRTQAGEVAAVLRARREARRSRRVLPRPGRARRCTASAPTGLDEVVYPSFAGPERDRLGRLQGAARGRRPRRVRRAALARAGNAHAVVRERARATPRTRRCARQLSDAFAAARRRVVRTTSDGEIFEKPALEEFPARTASR